MFASRYPYRNAREAAKVSRAVVLWKFSVLIARALRAAVDRENARRIYHYAGLRCNRADGTRTASLPACVALADAPDKLVASGKLKTNRYNERAWWRRFP